METQLYSIAYGCPKGNRDKDCPLLEVQNLSFKEKIDWIDELDNAEKEVILKHHENCTKSKKQSCIMSNSIIF